MNIKWAAPLLLSLCACGCTDDRPNPSPLPNAGRTEAKVTIFVGGHEDPAFFVFAPYYVDRARERMTRSSLGARIGQDWEECRLGAVWVLNTGTEDVRLSHQDSILKVQGSRGEFHDDPIGRSVGRPAIEDALLDSLAWLSSERVFPPGTAERVLLKLPGEELETLKSAVLLTPEGEIPLDRREVSRAAWDAFRVDLDRAALLVAAQSE